MVIGPDNETGRAELAAFCRRNGICRLAIFGSALRDGFGPDSDIDLLVEFETGRTPGMMGLAHMEAELEALLGGGRTVDLRTYCELNRYFRDDVRATAKPIFDAAA